MKPFAVFVFAPVNEDNSLFACTSRPTGDGLFGLPGGKVDGDEEPQNAVIREAAEEGFEIVCLNPYPIYQTIFDGKLVLWFAAQKAIPLKEFKEMGRVTPMFKTLKDISQSGFSNSKATAAYISRQSV